MTVSIEDDPVGFLDALIDSRHEKRKKAPHFPGTTPPRNTATTISEYDSSWLADLPFSEYLVGGVARKFYTVGALSKALGKSPVTIRSWEAKGWLPTASFRTPAPTGSQIPGKKPAGKRLYSLEQLLFLAESYHNFISEGNDWDGFKSHITHHYPRN